MGLSLTWGAGGRAKTHVETPGLSQSLFSSILPSCNAKGLSCRCVDIPTHRSKQQSTFHPLASPHPHANSSLGVSLHTQHVEHHTTPGSGLRIVWGRNSGDLFTLNVVWKARSKCPHPIGPPPPPKPEVQRKVACVKGQHSFKVTFRFLS